jgi:hypothetical protein
MFVVPLSHPLLNHEINLADHEWMTAPYHLGTVTASFKIRYMA